jgi:integrase
MDHFKTCGHNMRLHDTRHTFTTNLLNFGVSKRVAMTRTGHKDERMLAHYDHAEAGEIFEDNFSFMQRSEPVSNEKKGDSKRIR